MKLDKFQLNAIKQFSNNSKKLNESSIETLNHIFHMCDIPMKKRFELSSVIDQHYRVAIHFHPDRIDRRGNMVLKSLLEEGVYKNQFETGISNGGLSAYEGGERVQWEHDLFGDSFVRAPKVSRPKYGALDFRLFPEGPAPRFGSCYMVLSLDVMKRSTFTFMDSNLNSNGKATFGNWDCLLAELFTGVFINELFLGKFHVSTDEVVDILFHSSSNGYDETYFNQPVGRNLNHYVEAQIHGSIELMKDVERLVVDRSFVDSPPIRGFLNDIEAKYNIPVSWHPGFQLSSLEVPQNFRGKDMPLIARRIVGDGYLSVRELGGISERYMKNSEAVSMELGHPDPLQAIKYLWHILVKFGHSYNNK